MKYIKRVSLIILTVLFSTVAISQDLRTLETKVADLLAPMPARDAAMVERLVGEMLALGDAGLKMICNQVRPAGSGDDVKPRFAVESLSRYLSGYGTEQVRSGWEKICI